MPYIDPVWAWYARQLDDEKDVVVYQIQPAPYQRLDRIFDRLLPVQAIERRVAKALRGEVDLVYDGLYAEGRNQ